MYDDVWMCVASRHFSRHGCGSLSIIVVTWKSFGIAHHAVRSKEMKPREGKRFKVESAPHGNYPHYYGYRLEDGSEDPRLFALRASWFTDADVLDVGCNAGYFSLTVGAHFRPKSLHGVDIDASLVRRSAQLAVR